MSLSKLEQAMMIYFGGTVDISECNLNNAENPEETYLLKESISKLSSEAKMLMKVIIGLPNEMFDATGRVILQELNSYMKRKYKWDRDRVVATRKELKESLGALL